MQKHPIPEAGNEVPLCHLPLEHNLTAQTSTNSLVIYNRIPLARKVCPASVEPP
ncbi:hypothetical protein LROSL1_1358 [Furfurilactobacillus rossiae]|nr:hypothetical protein LROSL1_1358 [Furfurilactobacillus rossiae]